MKTKNGTLGKIWNASFVMVMASLLAGSLMTTQSANAKTVEKEVALTFDSYLHSTSCFPINSHRFAEKEKITWEHQTVIEKETSVVVHLESWVVKNECSKFKTSPYYTYQIETPKYFKTESKAAIEAQRNATEWTTGGDSQ